MYNLKLKEIKISQNNTQCELILDAIDNFILCNNSKKYILYLQDIFEENKQLYSIIIKIYNSLSDEKLK